MGVRTKRTPNRIHLEDLLMMLLERHNPSDERRPACAVFVNRPRRVRGWLLLAMLVSGLTLASCGSTNAILDPGNDNTADDSGGGDSGVGDSTGGVDGTNVDSDGFSGVDGSGFVHVGG